MVCAPEGVYHGASAASQKIPEKSTKTKASVSAREEKIMYLKLKSDRLRRQHRRNTAYAPQHQVCAVCGRDIDNGKNKTIL